MKFLTVMTFALLTSNSYGMDKETAIELLNFHDKTFSQKEIMSNQGSCKYYNELAESAEMPSKKLECSRQDLPTNDAMVEKTLKDVKTQSSVLNVKEMTDEEIIAISLQFNHK